MVFRFSFLFILALLLIFANCSKKRSNDHENSHRNSHKSSHRHKNSNRSHRHKNSSRSHNHKNNPDHERKTNLSKKHGLENQNIITNTQHITHPDAVIDNTQEACISFVLGLPNEIFLYIINEIFFDEHKRLIFSPSFRLVSNTWKKWHDEQYQILPIMAPSSKNAVLDCTDMGKGKCVVIKEMPKDKWIDIISLGPLVELKLSGLDLRFIDSNILVNILEKSAKSLTSIEFFRCKIPDLHFLKPCVNLHTIILNDCACLYGVTIRGPFPKLALVTKVVWNNVLNLQIKQMDNYDFSVHDEMRERPLFSKNLSILLNIAFPNMSDFTISYPNVDDWNMIEYIQGLQSLKHLTIMPAIDDGDQQRTFTGIQLFKVLDFCKNGLESLIITGYSSIEICSHFPEHALQNLKKLSIFGSNPSSTPTKVVKPYFLRFLTSLEEIVFDHCELESEDEELLEPIALKNFLSDLKVVIVNGRKLKGSVDEPVESSIPFTMK